MEAKTISIDAWTVHIEKLIGKGKSGYSYLAVDENRDRYVVKHIHHESCPSYTFDDKFQAELNAYHTLKELIRVPRLLAFDRDREILLKEYIDGTVASEVIARDEVDVKLLQEIADMTKSLYPRKINLDFFPSNFVTNAAGTYYIDYEVNNYMDEWNFENWGIYFFANPGGMKRFLDTGEIDEMLISAESGKPVRVGLETKVQEWLAQLR
ncbi:MAG: hypothetical protein ACOC0D_00790 [Spirochaeta sp.]